MLIDLLGLVVSAAGEHVVVTLLKGQQAGPEASQAAAGSQNYQVGSPRAISTISQCVIGVQLTCPPSDVICICQKCQKGQVRSPRATSMIHHPGVEGCS